MKRKSIQNGLNNLVKGLKDGLYSERDELSQEDTIPEETKDILEREINSRLGIDKINILTYNRSPTWIFQKVCAEI